MPINTNRTSASSVFLRGQMGPMGPRGPQGVQGPPGPAGSAENLTLNPEMVGSGLYYDVTTNILSVDINNIATTLFVENEIGSAVAGLVNSAPEVLNTLNELSIALGDDPNFATTVSNQIGLKANTADLATVAFSGSYNDLINKPNQDLNTTSDVEFGGLNIKDGYIGIFSSPDNLEGYLSYYTSAGITGIGLIGRAADATIPGGHVAVHAGGTSATQRGGNVYIKAGADWNNAYGHSSPAGHVYITAGQGGNDNWASRGGDIYMYAGPGAKDAGNVSIEAGSTYGGTAGTAGNLTLKAGSVGGAGTPGSVLIEAGEFEAGEFGDFNGPIFNGSATIKGKNIYLNAVQRIILGGAGINDVNEGGPSGGYLQLKGISNSWYSPPGAPQYSMGEGVIFYNKDLQAVQLCVTPENSSDGNLPAVYKTLSTFSGSYNDLTDKPDQSLNKADDVEFNSVKIDAGDVKKVQIDAWHQDVLFHPGFPTIRISDGDASTLTGFYKTPVYIAGDWTGDPGSYTWRNIYLGGKILNDKITINAVPPQDETDTFWFHEIWGKKGFYKQLTVGNYGNEYVLPTVRGEIGQQLRLNYSDSNYRLEWFTPEVTSDISSANVNNDGDLVITLSDTTEVNAGHVVGPQGPQGPQGPAGADGPAGTVIQLAYIFDGGSPTTTYLGGPAFDCGGVN